MIVDICVYRIALVQKSCHLKFNPNDKRYAGISMLVLDRCAHTLSSMTGKTDQQIVFFL